MISGFIRNHRFVGIAFFALMLMMLISACTNKDNLTGDNWSGIRPQTISDSLFTSGFSFPFEGKVSGKEPVLILGNHQSKDAMPVLRFTGLPENIDTAQNGELSFVVLRRSPYARGAISLNLYKLNQNWVADSTALVLDTNLSASALAANISVPDTISHTSGDTIRVLITANDIKNWKSENITGFNLALKTTDNGFIEIKSVESGNGPILKFDYTSTGSSTTKSYSSRAIMDSHRLNYSASEVVEDNWTMRNIGPSRIYMKFDLDRAKFVDAEGNPLSDQQYKRCTINRAELVLYIKNNPYYNGVGYSFIARNVVKDSVFSAIALTKDDMEVISFTPTSLGTVSGDSLKINITPLIQAFTSGDRENKGIVISSMQEMLNFGELEFWHFGDPSLPATKAPKINITYTAPFFE